MVNYGIYYSQPLYSSALEKVLELQPGIFSKNFETSYAYDVSSWIEKANNTTSLFFIEISVSSLDTIAIISEIKAKFPNICIIALSDFELEGATKMIHEYGANSVISKRAKESELFEAVLAAYNSFEIDRTWSTESQLNAGYTQQNILKNKKISKREIEFLRYSASELTYKQISGKMHASFSTVCNYRESLFLKLGVKSRVGLVLFAIENLIVNPYKIKEDDIN